MTLDLLAEIFHDPDHGFTHVHLLAHGVGPDRDDPAQPIDLGRTPPPSAALALEGADGRIHRCGPEELRSIFGEGVPRPEGFVLATCHGGEVKPLEAGGTLAHALHASGVPVVVASQLALTQEGSAELVDTFLRRVVDGDDPRIALRACRNALGQNRAKTYYDRFAVVGYVHLDQDPDERLMERKTAVALKRLQTMSVLASSTIEDAASRLAQDPQASSPDLHLAIEAVNARFEEVRQRLEALATDGQPIASQLEEVRGLQGSAFKRQSEAAWRLSRVLTDPDRSTWRSRSHELLERSRQAYRLAAEASIERHWAVVQSLGLEAIHQGDLSHCETDWIVARRASELALRRAEVSPSEETRREADWALGSLVELELLAPLVGRTTDRSRAKEHLDALAAAQRRSDDDLVQSTARQLSRYADWWGSDPHWRLPRAIVERASELFEHLRSKSDG